MKNKLWVFGDSYTENFKSDEGWSKKYIDWKGYTPKVYGEFISEKFNLELKNFGKGGTNNYQIFQNICDNIDSIDDNDVVIIQWSQQHRFRLVDKNNQWLDFFNDSDEYKIRMEKCDFISETTIKETIYNRLNSKWLEEMKSWEKIIKKSLPKNSLAFWSPFDDYEYGESRFVFETISKETNYIITDPHFSERGQENLSHILIKRLGLINPTKEIL